MSGRIYTRPRRRSQVVLHPIHCPLGAHDLPCTGKVAKLYSGRRPTLPGTLALAPDLERRPERAWRPAQGTWPSIGAPACARGTRARPIDLPLQHARAFRQKEFQPAGVATLHSNRSAATSHLSVGREKGRVLLGRSQDLQRTVPSQGSGGRRSAVLWGITPTRTTKPRPDMM